MWIWRGNWWRGRKRSARWSAGRPKPIWSGSAAASLKRSKPPTFTLTCCATSSASIPTSPPWPIQYWKPVANCAAADCASGRRSTSRPTPRPEHRRRMLSRGSTVPRDPLKKGRAAGSSMPTHARWAGSCLSEPGRSFPDNLIEKRVDFVSAGTLRQGPIAERDDARGGCRFVGKEHVGAKGNVGDIRFHHAPGQDRRAELKKFGVHVDVGLRPDSFCRPVQHVAHIAAMVDDIAAVDQGILERADRLGEGQVGGVGVCSILGAGSCCLKHRCKTY